MTLMIPSYFLDQLILQMFQLEVPNDEQPSQACQMLVRYGPPPEPSNFQLYKVRDSGDQDRLQCKKTRRRMARERRGAESSVASMETLNYKTIY